MIGDQVYADEDAPETREFIRARRGTDGEPGDDVADFEEYTRLYRETWGEHAIRWLLSVVALRDDLRRPRRPRRLEHLDLVAGGNAGEALVAPAHQRARSPATGSISTSGTSRRTRSSERGVLEHVRSAPRRRARAARVGGEGGLGQRGPALELQPRPRKRRAARDARLSRGPRARRAPASDVRRRRNGSGSSGSSPETCDHLLLADTLPIFLPPAIHNLESWNDAVAAGAWTRVDEGLRRAAAARARPGALGRVPRLVPAHGRADSRGRRRRARRRRRPPSSRSAATSTTPTSPRSTSRPRTGVRAPSGRRSARRSATRSASASARSLGRRLAPGPRRHRGAGPLRAACELPEVSGGSSSRRPSTTSSPRSTSTATGSSCGSRGRCPGTGAGPGSRPRSSAGWRPEPGAACRNDEKAALI